jgi:hypothetical protein
VKKECRAAVTMRLPCGEIKRIVLVHTHRPPYAQAPSGRQELRLNDASMPSNGLLSQDTVCGGSRASHAAEDCGRPYMDRARSCLRVAEQMPTLPTIIAAPTSNRRSTGSSRNSAPSVSPTAGIT